jgi:phage repressor protein C with HTH and peptisase S24 domain
VEKNFSERLKKIIDDKFEGKKKKFADALGVYPEYVSRWLSGGKGISQKNLRKLKELGINIGWLLYGTGEPYLSKENQVKPVEFQEVLIIRHSRVPVNAGKGYTPEFMEEYIKEPIRLYSPRFIAFEVNGDCMEPKIPNGARIIVEEKVEPRDGQIVVGVLDGILVCKVFRIIGKEIWLESINPNYEPERINGFREFKVIGVVRKVEWIP